MTLRFSRAAPWQLVSGDYTLARWVMSTLEHELLSDDRNVYMHADVRLRGMQRYACRRSRYRSAP